MKNKMGISASALARLLLFNSILFFSIITASQIGAMQIPEFDTIFITSGIADPATANVGEEINFSAGYFATKKDGLYKLYVCKDQRMEKNNQGCKSGSWCESFEFTGDNPLACKYTPDSRDKQANSFYMFVCRQDNTCSTGFFGFFWIAKGALTLEVPTKADFKPMAFSFSAQENTGNSLGDIVVTSLKKGGAQWSVDIMAEDWQNENSDTMQYAGDGISAGRLTVNLDEATIMSANPANQATLGETASFTPQTTNINIASADNKNGNGVFTIKNIKLDQFVPANQTKGNYATMLTFTIS